MSLSDELKRIFDSDRALRMAEHGLLRHKDAVELVALLERETEHALTMEDRTEGTMRLERLADLCAQVPGPRMTDALIAILNDPEPRVRVAAGEALRDLGYERYAELARGIERSLDRKADGLAMSELPWVLAEIAEPSALALIRRFLDHPSADVVAAAIESLAQLRDPESIPDLERFIHDARVVTIEDFEDEDKTTLGDLAADALDIVR
ncbi:MAG: HEAT repeat domain-containing protein [Deltaproteobacteria bacterium]|nr:HEAT repeat domain-containing protein [Deltaproteobacteria bacterium]NND27929.1 HEAT repeat domain-containing protein [Myxococcales bacterium]MBT8463118.1 HEAT repeat domain-containing protein [Deltaproteobacteria bacterium]MBT8482860.1 HEAT repeat domain-containing protein [Deltaproteobacteria bacterium]NNK08049.1 HEAT repeat domain-containing protein [Myxococcales bacterium]